MGRKKEPDAAILTMVARFLKNSSFSKSMVTFMAEARPGLTEDEVNREDVADIEEVYAFWKASNQGGKGKKRKEQTMEAPAAEPVKAKKRSKQEAAGSVSELEDGIVIPGENEGKAKGKKGATVSKKVQKNGNVEQEKAEVVVDAEQTQAVEGDVVNETADGAEDTEVGIKGKKRKTKEVKKAIHEDKEIAKGKKKSTKEESAAAAEVKDEKVEEAKVIKVTRGKKKAMAVNEKAVSVEDESAQHSEPQKEEIIVKAGKKGKKTGSMKALTTAKETEVQANGHEADAKDKGSVKVEGEKKTKKGKSAPVDGQSTEDRITPPLEDSKSPVNAIKSPAFAADSAERHGTAARAFQRVKVAEVEFKDERLKDNSYWAKNGAETGWGAKAQEVLGQVRGKDFRHEKTKKKRGSYKGGIIDLASHSIKFQDSDEDE